MAQKKSKKRKSSMPTGLNPCDKVYRDAISFAGRHNGYAKMLKIKDDSLVKSIETKLNPEEQNLFKLICAGNLGKLPDLHDQTPLISTRITINDPETLLMTFASCTVGLISDTFEHPELRNPDLGLQRPLYEALSKLERKIPDTFYDKNVSTQCQKHIFTQYADPFSNGISDLLDWDVLLKSQDPTIWATNIQDLLGAVLPDEYAETMEARRIEILTEILDMIRKDLPDYLAKGKDRLADYGVQLNPMVLPKKVPEVPLIPSVSPISLLASPQPVPLDKILQQDMVKAEPWMIYLMACAEFLQLENMARFRKKLLQRFTVNDLSYAAFITLAAAKKSNRFNGIAEMMTDILILHKFTSEPVQKFIEPNDSENGAVLQLETFEDRPLPKEIYKKCLREADDLGTASPTDISLWQVIAQNTNIMPHDEIVIRLKWMSLFKAMGYDEQTATALCGYIEALKLGRTHSIMTGVYTREMNRIIDKTDDDKQDEPDDTHSAFDEQLQQMQQEHTQRLNAAQQKTLKLEKAVRHADEQSRVLQEKNARLEEQVQTLTREKQKLLDKLEAIKMASVDDTTDETDTQVNADLYPSSIGADHKIICFGGTDVWRNEQHKRFPNIQFFAPEIDPNDVAVANADIVFVNTWVFKHKRFWKVQGVAKRTNTPIMIFPKKGINSCSQFIIDTYNNRFCRSDSTGKDVTRE